MKDLLIEYMPFIYNASDIKEASMNRSRFIVKGPLQRAGTKNQNGRIYPKEVLIREAEKYSNTEIAQKRALGELDHPDSTIVNLKNVSHNILKLEWKGDELWGTIEVLNTPSGRILQELFKHGITIGISSRGTGSVRQLDETTLEVQPDFQLVCWDFVSNPSTQGAFMYRVNENIDINKPNMKFTEAHSLITDIICELSGACCIKNK